mgnify:CR=1 FL=1
MPQQDELKIDPNAAYVHVCYNNTIYGTEYHYIPETNGVPLFADMSSDMLSRPVDFHKFDFIYAGVQKNLGPAGVVLVVAKKSLLEKSPEKLPTMFRYSTFYKKDSLYNTPPAFCIYMVARSQPGSRHRAVSRRWHAATSARQRSSTMPSTIPTDSTAAMRIRKAVRS